MKEINIYYGEEVMKMDEEGNISRPAIEMKASGDWKVVGAVLLNNFGHCIATVSLAEILDGKIKEWKYKNGKQKWHITDCDHGSIRVWMSPDHSIEVSN